MPLCLTLLVSLVGVVAQADLPPDSRHIRNGYEIPSEGYCDQPYVVVTADGHWVCTLTTGPGAEGNDRQHVTATISEDRGKTWSPLIGIEPQGPPEASWVMPLIVPSGRIYAFYVYNGDNLREVIAGTDYARRRVDTLGHFVFRYSDDGGRTWSPERHRIPIRTFDIDRRNPYGGDVQFFWGVGKPILEAGRAYMGLAKIASFGQGFIEESEGIFLLSDNIVSEPDPAKLRWETLPAGGVGLRAPRGPIAEEQNLVALRDGSLYCTYRTVEGHPCHAYSRDGGRSWTGPEYMTYTPGGRMVKHPRAANFVRKFSNGKFLYWFHNHGGKSYEGRNPAWLAGGIERDGFIRWSQPEIVLYDDDPKVRMSYPDFIEQDGRVYITETQKSVARVHPIDPGLLEMLWTQHERKSVAREDLLLELAGERCRAGAAETLLPLPKWIPGEGMTVELWLTSNQRADATLLDTRDAAGKGFAVGLTARGGLTMTLSDGAVSASLNTEPNLITPDIRHHAVFIVDAGPRLLLVVLDGQLLDGGDTLEQGWHRLPDGLTDVNSGPLRFLDAASGQVEMLRVYGRYLRVSEAIGNYRAGL
jgi:hypothetical protein